MKLADKLVVASLHSHIAPPESGVVSPLIQPRQKASAELDDHSRLERYVEACEGAEFLSIHPKTLIRLAREGKIPAYPYNEGTRRHWRFQITELDKWMKAKVNSSAHPVRPRPAGERRK